MLMTRDEARKGLHQRLWDLVRYQRSDLHTAGLITNEEYMLLAEDHAAVARLEDYDQLRAKLTACEQEAAKVREESTVPAHPFEVRINIGGDDWDYVLRTMERLAEHLREHGPECGMCSGGAGGSHSVSIAKRNISVEEFHAELQAWHSKLRAATKGEKG